MYCAASNKLIYRPMEDVNVTKWGWVGDTVVFRSSMSPYFLNPAFLACLNYGPLNLYTKLACNVILIQGEY